MTSVPSTKVLGALSYPPPAVHFPLRTTKGNGDWDDIQIYGVGYDGNDTVIVGAYHYPTFEYRLYVTTTELTTPTQFDMDTITGWTTGIFQNFSHIQWSSTLSRWVAYTGRGQGFYCDDDPSVAANWTEITYPQTARVWEFTLMSEL